MAQAILITPREGAGRRACRSRSQAAQDARARGDRAQVARRRAARSWSPRTSTQCARARRTATRPSTWCWRCDDAETVSKHVQNAGAIFLGHYTPVAVGDYLAGPNHVLPTGGTARFFSPLGVEDFLKRTSVMRFEPPKLRELGARRDAARRARGAHGPRDVGGAAAAEDPAGAPRARSGPRRRGGDRAMSERSERKARGRAQDARDRDPGRARSRRQRASTRSPTGHAVLRPHARVVREARPVRPAARAPRAISQVDHAPHGRGRRHHARPGVARGARRPPRASAATAPPCCRWRRPRSRWRSTSRTDPISCIRCSSRTRDRELRRAR